MTREEYSQTIRDISAATNDNEQVITLLANLQNGYNEIVDRQPEFTREQVYADDTTTWRDKYNNMREKYLDAFFSGKKTPEDDVNKLPPDNATEIKIENLFK